MKFERKYTINQWVKWNRRLSEAIEDFYASFSIHPIILEANLHTQSQIDFLVNVVPGEKEKLHHVNELTNEVSYLKFNEKVGINQFSTGNCSLEFAVDDQLEDKEFVLVYDSDPEWGDDDNDSLDPVVEDFELVEISV